MFVWKKYVYEVYKERSFTKAAQNLYISQPSLSARIKKIEEIILEFSGRKDYRGTVI